MANEQSIDGDELQSLVQRRYDAHEFFANELGSQLQPLLQERMTECRQVISSHNWQSQGHKFPTEDEPFSDLWFAGNIAAKILPLLQKETAFAPLDVLRAMAMESLWSDWQWRKAFAKEIKLGKGRRQHGKDWSDTQNFDHKNAADEITNFIDNYIKEKPGATLAQATRGAKRDLNLEAKPESIAKRYRRKKSES